jgi:hypothetical protein
MVRWTLLLVAACGPIEERQYCEYADKGEYCPAEVSIEGAIEGESICLDGEQVHVVEAGDDVVEGAEERIYDEQREIWILARQCCYPLEVRPQGACSDE